MIPIGFLAAAGAGVKGDFVLLDSRVLGSAEASVTFSNLNTSYGSLYRHLQIRYVARSSVSANVDDLAIRFNSDSGTNYGYHVMETSGAGNVESFFSGSSQQEIGWNRVSGATATTESFGVGVIDILDAFQSTKNTTTRSFNGEISTSRRLRLTSGLWLNTAAITTINIRALGGNIVTNSRIALYGVK